MLRQRLISILFAVAVLVSASATATAQPVTPPWRYEPPAARPRVTVTAGDVAVQATLAQSPRESSLGLGYRDELPEGTGMLFVYDEPSVRTFWMKGMRFCIDIIWIEGGEIVGAAESVCPSPFGTFDADLPRFRSPEPVRYVLEVPAGWMEEHGLDAGTPVSFDPEPAALLPGR